MLATHTTNLNDLLVALNTANSWVQLDKQFLVVNSGIPSLYIWVGEVTEADLQPVQYSPPRIAGLILDLTGSRRKNKLRDIYRVAVHWQLF